MPEDANCWYRVVQFDKDGKFVSVVPYDSWKFADSGAKEMEKLFPEHDIQLWVRER